MARILLIDDDPALLDVLVMAFEDAGHDVVSAGDGAAGLEWVDRILPDLVVSDVNMPRVDGFALCRRVRERYPELPVILLTSRDSEIDEALGLDWGADDYVTKPFSTRVLLARAAALLRRGAVRAGAASQGPRAVGPLVIDLDRVEVRYLGAHVPTTVSELRLLDTLTRRPGLVLARDRLMEGMRGDDSFVDERIVDTYVRRLRRKLEAVDPDFDLIETVVGAGYRWAIRGR